MITKQIMFISKSRKLFLLLFIAILLGNVQEVFSQRYAIKTECLIMVDANS